MKQSVKMCVWTKRQRRIRKTARRWARKPKHRNILTIKIGE